MEVEPTGLEDIGSQDVGGHQVGRERDAPEADPEDLSQGGEQAGLAEAGHPLQEEVSLTEHRHQHLLHQLGLPHDHSGYLRAGVGEAGGESFGVRYRGLLAHGSNSVK